MTPRYLHDTQLHTAYSTSTQAKAIPFPFTPTGHDDEIPSTDTTGNPPLRTAPSRSSSCRNDEDIDQGHHRGGLGTIQETEIHHTHADIGIRYMLYMRNFRVG